jgi:hypothetical protein
MHIGMKKQNRSTAIQKCLDKQTKIKSKQNLVSETHIPDSQ